MDDRPGGPTPERADPRCPACDGPRVQHHVSRSDGWSRPAPERSLVWECRDCQTRWTERFVAFFNDDPTSETSSGPQTWPADVSPRPRSRTPKDPI